MLNYKDESPDGLIPLSLVTASFTGAILNFCISDKSVNGSISVNKTSLWLSDLSYRRYVHRASRVTSFQFGDLGRVMSQGDSHWFPPDRGPASV